MQLQDKRRIAILSAYALALHGFESLLPAPIPWLKLGLANIITLVALILYGFRTALVVTLIRVVLASIFIGAFLGPAFILSAGGGIASVAAMGLTIKLFKNLFGAVGISLIGALFHNMAQLSLAYFLFIHRLEAVLIISPFILLIGSLTGIVNGIISGILIKNLLKKDAEKIQNTI
ncbi:MAG: heptaprenyl diphosphate synthase [Nitrospira bacterium HGW-Nitrospira-1]|nr:MAG: heptaprenyl diphosphate synthase [Nitrospira bacterium HGW-Nitrospira-1]